MAKTEKKAAESSPKRKTKAKVTRKPSVRKKVKVEESTEKDVGGRPRVYDSEAELNAEIIAYFEYIKGEYEMVPIKDPDTGATIDTVQVWKRHPENPAITGLALYLGFESRQSIYDYEKTGRFSYAIKRARLRVENGYEQALLSKASTGAIFALKNFGWTDKQEIESTNINLNSDVIVTDDEAVRIKKALESKY